MELEVLLQAIQQELEVGAVDTRYGTRIAGNADNNSGGNGINEYHTAGGGAGNLPGVGTNNLYDGEPFVGGLLVIYANNVEMENEGKVDVSGGKGGNAQVGGGASGGGSINIFYRNNYKEGRYNVEGGNTSGTTSKGGAGGKGTISVGKIQDGTYVSVYTNY